MLMQKFNITKMLIFGQMLMYFSATYADEKLRAATRTNFNECKISQFGTEYHGSISTTAGGIRCQSWHSENQLHDVDPDIIDGDFPEKSTRLAKNYCRNPTADPKGPWCYTMETNLIDDECGIPLCNFGECRVSSTGAEYAGTRATSTSGKKCKFWDKRYKTTQGKTEKYPNKNFPDSSKTKAKNFCRNPDDDPGGPWCYVEEEGYELVEREYCDVPFCSDRDCLVYTKNASEYSVITSMNSTLGSTTVWVKLWNPLDETKGEARILLSVLPIPTSSRKIAHEWRAGSELLISNSGSGQIYPTSDGEIDLEPTPGILLSSNWTALSINWGGGFISVSLQGSTKPIFLDEYGTKGSISSFYENSFFYYGLMGTGVMWSTEHCQDTCEVHTTFGMDFLRLWPLQRGNTTYDVNFYVRANEKIGVRLYQSPGSPYPCFTIVIGESNTVALTYQESLKSAKQHLKEVSGANLLDYWSWKGFSISIFGPHLRLYSERHYGNEEILYAKEHLFSTLRWYSAGSDGVIAHWSFFCSPEAENPVEPPSPPECLSNPMNYLYQGTQWITEASYPCIPWTAKGIPDEEKVDSRFPDGSTIRALNKCRNPGHDPKGPYCYADSSSGLLKSYCSIRSCRSSECRTAGTANDYIGTLSVTRSGRTCAPWVSDYDLQNLKREKQVSTTATISSTVSPTKPTTISQTPKSRFRLVDTKGNPDTKQIDLDKYISEFFGRPAGNVDKPKEEKSKTEDKLNEDKPKEKKLEPVESKLRERFKRPIHRVNPEYFNDTLYPEQSARNASNYCRDPSRNIAGAWCYTTDPFVPQDLCDVRDCDKSDECIFLVRGQGYGRRIFILPEHRSEGLRFSLKAWEPDNPDSIVFTFSADDGLRSKYILKIGAMDNEKVLLYYQPEEGGIELVKKKILPHLLYLGKWSSFVIKIPRGKVQVYYEGAPNALFAWEHPNPLKAFLPIYYHYGSELGNTVGVSFDCLSSCQVETTETDRFTRILPVPPNSQKIELMVRASGVVLVPLLLFPATPGYYALTLGEMGQWMFFLKNTYPNIQIFHKQKVPSSNLFTKNSWTNVTIAWYNSTLNAFWNGSLTFNYEHTHPLLFYFFSLAVDKGGWATWTANCLPPDIDGEPVDGGWSEWGPWACSASCNGGIGMRKRLCNNPEPNVKGEPCMGPSVMTGRCNTIRCGDITEDTVNLIKRRLRRNRTSIIVKEGESTIIPADDDVIEIIARESTDPEINWSHNGIFVNPDDYRVRLVDQNIVIKRTEVNDSGVYTITLHRVDGTHMILKLVSLAVLPVKTIVTLRETMPVTVVCHCVILGYLYNDLKVLWMINKKLWKNYGTTQPITVNVDQIPSLNLTHRGLWECLVRQDDFGFNWTTNSIFINVISPPNWKTHLMEDKLTKPIFGWMPSESAVALSVFIILLFFLVATIIGTIWYIRFQSSLKRAKPQNVIQTQVGSTETPMYSKPTKISTRKRVFEKFQKLSKKREKRTNTEEAEKLLSNPSD